MTRGVTLAAGLLALASTSPAAFADCDVNGHLSAPDPVGAFDLVLAGSRGKGARVVFGDDALFQNQLLVDNNHRLGEDLAGWLAEAP